MYIRHYRQNKVCSRHDRHSRLVGPNSCRHHQFNVPAMSPHLPIPIKTKKTSGRHEEPMPACRQTPYLWTLPSIIWKREGYAEAPAAQARRLCIDPGAKGYAQEGIRSGTPREGRAQGRAGQSTARPSSCRYNRPWFAKQTQSCDKYPRSCIWSCWTAADAEADRHWAEGDQCWQKLWGHQSCYVSRDSCAYCFDALLHDPCSRRKRDSVKRPDILSATESFVQAGKQRAAPLWGGRILRVVYSSRGCNHWCQRL